MLFKLAFVIVILSSCRTAGLFPDNSSIKGVVGECQVRSLDFYPYRSKNKYNCLRIAFTQEEITEILDLISQYKLPPINSNTNTGSNPEIDISIFDENVPQSNFLKAMLFSSYNGDNSQVLVLERSSGQENNIYNKKSTSPLVNQEEYTKSWNNLIESISSSKIPFHTYDMSFVNYYSYEKIRNRIDELEVIFTANLNQERNAEYFLIDNYDLLFRQHVIHLPHLQESTALRPDYQGSILYQKLVEIITREADADLKANNPEENIPCTKRNRLSICDPKDFEKYALTIPKKNEIVALIDSWKVEYPIPDLVSIGQEFDTVINIDSNQYSWEQLSHIQIWEPETDSHLHYEFLCVYFKPQTKPNLCRYNNISSIIESIEKSPVPIHHFKSPYFAYKNRVETIQLIGELRKFFSLREWEFINKYMGECSLPTRNIPDMENGIEIEVIKEADLILTINDTCHADTISIQGLPDPLKEELLRLLRN